MALPYAGTLSPLTRRVSVLNSSKDPGNRHTPQIRGRGIPIVGSLIWWIADGGSSFHNAARLLLVNRTGAGELLSYLSCKSCCVGGREGIRSLRRQVSLRGFLRLLGHGAPPKKCTIAAWGIGGRGKIGFGSGGSSSATAHHCMTRVGSIAGSNPATTGILMLSAPGQYHTPRVA